MSTSHFTMDWKVASWTPLAPSPTRLGWKGTGVGRTAARGGGGGGRDAGGQKVTAHRTLEIASPRQARRPQPPQCFSARPLRHVAMWSASCTIHSGSSTGMSSSASLEKSASRMVCEQLQSRPPPSLQPEAAKERWPDPSGPGTGSSSLLVQASSRTMPARSSETLCNWPSSWAAEGCSMNFTVFTREGASTALTALCAASISAGESPSTTRFAPQGRWPFMICLKAMRFHEKGSPGYACSYCARADVTVRRLSRGTSPGRKRCELSCTQEALPLVTIMVSPSSMAVRRACSAARSSNSSCGRDHCARLIAELQRRVSSQSKMMSVSSPPQRANLGVTSRLCTVMGLPSSNEHITALE
mmetsp:Transcript_23780/g.73778  ORF Transcript_23780/g.73778 Transcript_23780/m.73778 type:complete len:358 (-) Transcript_23780:118-1191(-)